MTNSFAHKKSLGQHFLNSPIVQGWLCDAAGELAGKTVLEIGPGTGALTRELLARDATVLALEADPRAIEALKEAFPPALKSGQLTVLHTDVRSLELASLGLVSQSFQVVANIPYYLTGYLFRTLLEQPILPNQLVFLVQFEVAKRACARLDRGEKESLLSLSLQLFGTPEYIRKVSKGHFTPPPQVDSAIMAVRNIRPFPLPDIPPEFMFTVLHAGFGQKRKQLQGNLRALFPTPLIMDSLSTVGLPADIRAEDIACPQWLQLATLLYPHYSPQLIHG